MSAIQAVYHEGVFHPIGPVDLPEGSVVRLVAEKAAEGGVAPLDIPQDEALDAVYEILSRRYSGGDPYVSARHNEHQP